MLESYTSRDALELEALAKKLIQLELSHEISQDANLYDAAQLAKSAAFSAHRSAAFNETVPRSAYVFGFSFFKERLAENLEYATRAETSANDALAMAQQHEELKAAISQLCSVCSVVRRTASHFANSRFYVAV